ncbi:MAG: hypothetical protein ACK2UO_04685 [Caldilineaceae bacterium]|jgi:hypothetical protein
MHARADKRRSLIACPADPRRQFAGFLLLERTTSPACNPGQTLSLTHDLSMHIAIAIKDVDLIEHQNKLGRAVTSRPDRSITIRRITKFDVNGSSVCAGAIFRRYRRRTKDERVIGVNLFAKKGTIVSERRDAERKTREREKQA